MCTSLKFHFFCAIIVICVVLLLCTKPLISALKQAALSSPSPQPPRAALNNHGHYDADELFATYLKPYFDGKLHTLHRGDLFHVDGPRGVIKFQCLEIDTTEADGFLACVVVEDTLIECEGKAINRNDVDDLLADAGYDAIGGVSCIAAPGSRADCGNWWSCRWCIIWSCVQT